MPSPRRSDPAISRFNPVLGWLTIIVHLARLCRAPESTASSVPDCNALWSRAEDDLLVQAVAKYGTPNVLGRDCVQIHTGARLGGGG